MINYESDLIDFKLKVVVLGDPSSGKTCLINRYCHNDFSRQYYPTLGVDFILRRTALSNQRNVRVYFWDLSGQSLNSTLLQIYLYGANVIVLCYDITNATSFTKLNDWLNAAKNFSYEKIPTYALIANKSDMEHQRAVSVEKQLKFSTDNNMSSHSVSARTGENVSLTFQRICAEALGFKLSKQEQEAQQSVIRAEIVNVPTQIHATYQTAPSAICSIQ